MKAAVIDNVVRGVLCSPPQASLKDLSEESPFFVTYPTKMALNCLCLLCQDTALICSVLCADRDDEFLHKYAHT